MSSIELHRYALTPRHAPNRLSGNGARAGALLRVRFEGLCHAGHADLFPWPELGDEPLELQLKALKEGLSFRLGAASLEWARLEAQALDKGQALLNGKPVSCHCTLTHPTDFPAVFSHAKLKVDQAMVSDWQRVETFMRQHPGVRWRLDFNNLFESTAQALHFWQGVSDDLKARIDFLEDPYASELMEVVSALRVFHSTRVALDRCPTPAALAGAQVWVMKPVTFAPDYFFQQAQLFHGDVVLTSNMDHPLGQLIALSAAQRLKTRVNGLMTQELYHPHAASDWLTSIGADLNARHEGPGWGVGAQLAALAWEEL